MVLDLFWEVFGSMLGGQFAYFSDFAKKVRPLESAVNSSQIEGRVPQKTTKMLPKREWKNGMKMRANKNMFFY